MSWDDDGDGWTCTVHYDMQRPGEAEKAALRSGTPNVAGGNGRRVRQRVGAPSPLTFVAHRTRSRTPTPKSSVLGFSPVAAAAPAAAATATVPTAAAHDEGPSPEEEEIAQDMLNNSRSQQEAEME